MEEYRKEDIQKIIKDHRSRTHKNIETTSGSDEPRSRSEASGPSASEIPDLFFDHILVQYKLSRVEVLVLMYLYRQVWCRPNLHREHGISPMLSHEEMASEFHIEMDQLYSALKKLEDFGFISTVRFGQYFVRRYFQKEYDDFYRCSYGDFDV